MVDTVIIEIIISLSAILNPKRFKPEITGWIFEDMGFKKFINNPTEEEKNTWGYLPRLTVLQRVRTLVLKMEFSVLKMISGDNINEPEGNHTETIINRVREVVENMGVRLNNEQIKKAQVLGFQPSKNFILSEGYNPAFIINEFRKADISKKFDIDCKQYRNGGEVLQFYSNQHALCFYDKMRDDRKPAKRAFDKDRTENQSSLFESKKPEILRMEARLKGSKFKEVFEKIGYGNPKPTFEEVLDKSLSQKILKYYWEYFFGDNMFLFDMRNNPQKVLNLILAKYKDKKMNLYRVFGLVGFILCSRDEDGIIGMRNVVSLYKPKNNWSKTKKWLEDFSKDLDKSYLHGFIKDIEVQLDKFEPLKLST